MYTSGTTGDPKGALISNESIITLLAGVKRLLESLNEKVSIYLLYFTCNYLKLNALCTLYAQFLFI